MKREYYNNWLNSLPDELKKQLDYSFESLKPLEKDYIRTTIREKILAEDNLQLEGFDELLSPVVYYVVEVFIKQAPMEMEHSEHGVQAVEYAVGSRVVPDKIFSIAKAENKEGYDPNQFYLYNSCIQSHKNHVAAFNRNDRREHPDEFALAYKLTDSFSYQYFLLHKSTTSPLSQIKTLLEAYFSSQINPPELSYSRKNKKQLIIKMNNDYHFYFEFKHSDRVSGLIQEMAEGDYSGNLNKNEVAQCQSTTEFWGDLDSNMDYMNEALWLLEHVAPKLPDLVTIYSRNIGEEIYP